MAIVLATPASAVRGTSAVDATFTAPGAKVSTTGLSLTVINSCDTSVFPSAATMSPTGSTYYYGQGDLAVSVQYALDSKLCGGYSIQIAQTTSTFTGGPVDAALITTTPTTANSFTFKANQPGLSGTLKYTVRIGVSGTTVLSPSATWTVGVYRCD